MTTMTIKPLAAALLAGTLALAAPALHAHEFFTGKLTVIHPWTSATEPGQTSAVVSMKFQDVTETDRLVGVRTPVAGPRAPNSAARQWAHQRSTSRSRPAATRSCAPTASTCA